MVRDTDLEKEKEVKKNTGGGKKRGGNEASTPDAYSQQQRRQQISVKNRAASNSFASDKQNSHDSSNSNKRYVCYNKVQKLDGTQFP